MGSKLFLTSLICLSLTSAFNAFAAETRFENSMSEQIQKMNELDLEKKQAELMVKRLSQSGRLSVNEAKKAMRSIASIKEQESNEISHSVLKEMRPNTVATK